MYPVALPLVTEADIQAVTNVLESGWISSSSPVISEFEATWNNLIPNTSWLTVSNGTVALQLALKSIGIGPGSIVGVPDITFAATINAVLEIGATPVILPVDDSLLLDTDFILRSHPEVDAIICVGLYNNINDFESLKKMGDQLSCEIILDWAEVNPLNPSVPLFASHFVTTFSFFANKFLTTGEGGIVGFPQEILYQKARIIRDHGMDPAKRYWHIAHGSNYRMTAMQAALGISKFKSLRESLKNKAYIHSLYSELCEKLSPLISVYSNGSESKSNNPPWLFTVFLRPNIFRQDARESIMKQLLETGIETRPTFYPLSSMPCYTPYIIPVDYSTSHYSLYGISLPFYDTLEDEDVVYIINRLTKQLKDHEAYNPS